MKTFQVNSGKRITIGSRHAVALETLTQFGAMGATDAELAHAMGVAKTDSASMLRQGLVRLRLVVNTRRKGMSESKAGFLRRSAKLWRVADGVHEIT